MGCQCFFLDEVACADPEECMDICQNPSGCSNIAYPLLVIRILPQGKSSEERYLTLSQTSNSELFKIERVCRRQI